MWFRFFSGLVFSYLALQGLKKLAVLVIAVILAKFLLGFFDMSTDLRHVFSISLGLLVWYKFRRR